MLTSARPPADELPVSAGVLAVATQLPAWIVVADRFRLFSTGVSFETEVWSQLSSFERGTMPEELCAPRVRSLSD